MLSLGTKHNCISLPLRRRLAPATYTGPHAQLARVATILAFSGLGQMRVAEVCSKAISILICFATDERMLPACRTDAEPISGHPIALGDSNVGSAPSRGNITIHHQKCAIVVSILCEYNIKASLCPATSIGPSMFNAPYQDHKLKADKEAVTQIMFNKPFQRFTATTFF